MVVDAGHPQWRAGHPQWRTVGFVRTILVVVRTMTTLDRLRDVLALTGPDPRIQTYFTHDPAKPAVLGGGVRRCLEQLGMDVLPWRQAARTRFGLAVAASENDRLHQLRTPVLLLPHGVGYQKYYPGGTVVAGMDLARLRHRGRVVPAAIALPHASLRERLRAACPAAADRSVVVGDPSLDRMLAGQHRRERYLAALGATGRRLVVVASTWGPWSLAGGWPDLPARLVAQLPADEYQVALVLHPGVWAAHGQWQVRAWLGQAQAGGVCVLSPVDGWQAALTAAACVLSDQGSLSLYSAALGRPLLLAPGDSPTTVAGSALAGLAAQAPRFAPYGDLRGQIDAAIAGHRPEAYQPVVQEVFDQPGQCAPRLRPLLYRLLDLDEPAGPPAFAPVAVPEVPARPAAALVVGADVAADAVALTRFPDLRAGFPHDQLDHRHLIADVDDATVGQLGGATILARRGMPAAAHLLDRWPAAVMVATAVDPHTCQVHTRELTAMLSLPERPSGVDPLLLASLAYVRLRSLGRLPERDRLRIGERAIEVVVEAGPTSADNGLP